MKALNVPMQLPELYHYIWQQLATAEAQVCTNGHGERPKIPIYNILKIGGLQTFKQFRR
jgi:hypothetical protein